jgi:hypothetical protein
MLISMKLGVALAAAWLRSTVLMRGHGSTVVGASLSRLWRVLRRGQRTIADAGQAVG